MYKKDILIILITLFILGLILWGIIILSPNIKPYRITKVAETRSEIVFKTSTIEVDNILLPYVIEFIDEAFEYDIDIEQLSKIFTGVYYDETPRGLIGIFYRGQNPYCLISPLLETTINKLRITVFHELSHYYLNRKHCHTYCKQIMSEIFNVYAVYNNWDEQKRILFEHKPHNNYYLYRI